VSDKQPTPQNDSEYEEQYENSTDGHGRVARHRRWRGRRLATKEINYFAAQNSSLKKNLDRAMMEFKEKESMLEGLGAELEVLKRMRAREGPSADESQERKADAVSVEDAVEQELALFTELLAQLTRKV
jgi:hypothetical protein